MLLFSEYQNIPIFGQLSTFVLADKKILNAIFHSEVAEVFVCQLETLLSSKIGLVYELWFPNIEQPPTASEAREVIYILFMSPTPVGGGHIPSFNFQKGQTVSEALLILRKTITILL